MSTGVIHGDIHFLKAPIEAFLHYKDNLYYPCNVKKSCYYCQNRIPFTKFTIIRAIIFEDYFKPTYAVFRNINLKLIKKIYHCSYENIDNYIFVNHFFNFIRNKDVPKRFQKLKEPKLNEIFNEFYLPIKKGTYRFLHEE